MKLKTVCVVFVVIFVKISSCESELEETRGEPSPLDRAVDIGTYIQSWINNINWVDFNNNKFVSFPQKVIPIYLNVTELQTRAYIGGLLLAGLGGYILTQIPIIDGLRRSTDYDDDLGYGRTYDEFGDEYDISTEYEYSYPDSFYSAASEPAGNFVRKKKKNSGEWRSADMKRRTGDPGTPGAKARRQKEPGLFDTITNAVKSIFNPNLKRSDTLLGGGLEAIVKRYDKYWKTRRSSAGKPNWELNLNTPRKQARSEDISVSSGESFIGPSLPSVKEAGSGFYQDRGRVSDYYFDDESQ